MTRRLCSLVATASLVLCAQAVRADDSTKPRAAVVITVADGMDNFVEAYLFEVAASVLRSDGYEVAPPHATRAQLHAVGSTAGDCAGDEACVAELARRIGAPTLLFIDAVPREGEEIRVVVRGATVRVDGVTLSSEIEAEGSETAMGQPVQAQAERLTDTTPPCHLDVDAPGIEVVVTVDDGAPIRQFPLFVEPGSHSVQVTAPGRADYGGRFRCEAGKRYRVSVR